MDNQLLKTRDHQVAYMFMKRLVKAFGEPKFLTIDKDPTLLYALKKLKQDGCYANTNHCTIKHFNNLIEQDHRHIKQRFAKFVGFQNLRHTSRTIKGIEPIHSIYKRKRSLQPNCAFSTYKELQELLGTA